MKDGKDSLVGRTFRFEMPELGQTTAFTVETISGLRARVRDVLDHVSWIPVSYITAGLENGRLQEAGLASLRRPRGEIVRVCRRAHADPHAAGGSHD